MTKHTVETVYRTIDPHGRPELHSTVEDAEKAIRRNRFEEALSKFLHSPGNTATLPRACLNRAKDIIALLAQWEAGYSVPDAKRISMVVEAGGVLGAGIRVHLNPTPSDVAPTTVINVADKSEA